MPGILNWALVGLKEWHEIGSNPPSIVLEATEEYRRESDSIGAFIDARCQITPAGGCYNKVIRPEYKRFCDDTGFDIESQKEFTAYLKRTEGVRWKKSKRGVVWHGIDLIPEGGGHIVNRVCNDMCLRKNDGSDGSPVFQLRN